MHYLSQEHSIQVLAWINVRNRNLSINVFIFVIFKRYLLPNAFVMQLQCKLEVNTSMYAFPSLPSEFHIIKELHCMNFGKPITLLIVTQIHSTYMVYVSSICCSNNRIMTTKVWPMRAETGLKMMLQISIKQVLISPQNVHPFPCIWHLGNDLQSQTVMLQNFNPRNLNFRIRSPNWIYLVIEQSPERLNHLDFSQDKVDSQDNTWISNIH